MKKHYKFFLPLFLCWQIAIAHVNTNIVGTTQPASSGMVIYDAQSFYAVPNTLVANTEVQIIGTLAQQETIQNSITCLPQITIKKQEYLAIIKPKQPTQKILIPKNDYKPKTQLTVAPSKNSTNYCSSLGMANKLSTTPNVLNHWAIVVLTETVNQPTTKNYQPTTKTYSNPTLGLALQNTTPVYNKPPPFI
jgi:hypothetical protein